MKWAGRPSRPLRGADHHLRAQPRMLAHEGGELRPGQPPLLSVHCQPAFHAQGNPPQELSTLESGTPIGGPSFLKLTVSVKVDLSKQSWLRVQRTKEGFLQGPTSAEALGPYGRPSVGT
jgi:hypothetical protein